MAALTEMWEEALDVRRVMSPGSPGLLPPPGNLVLVPLGRPARRDLHAPADPVQQHIQPGQRVPDPEPLMP
jgi:hypothetical protein